MNAARAIPVFSTAFVILYAVGISLNNTFLFYYPKINTWHWGRIPRGTPGIGIPSQWYGWTSEAIVGALIVSAVYLAIPVNAKLRGWPAWPLVVAFAAWIVALDVIAHNFWLPKPG